MDMGTLRAHWCSPLPLVHRVPFCVLLLFAYELFKGGTSEVLEVNKQASFVISYKADPDRFTLSSAASVAWRALCCVPYLL